MNDIRKAMRAVEIDDAAEAAVEDTLEELAQVSSQIGVQERQLRSDAALRDAVEVVRRARARNGRSITSLHDGTIIRKISELLRSVSDGEDKDPSWT